MPIVIEKLADEPSGFFTSCELGLDTELSGTILVAWVRGMLQACFGAPTNLADEYKGTFEYVLRVRLDDGQPVDVGITDWKGNLRCHTYGMQQPLPGQQPLSPEQIEAALRELRRRLLRTPAVDYEANFLWEETIPYGCHYGSPYVLERAAIAVEIEPAAASTAPARAAVPSEAELEAFFARTAPPSSPPLSAVREHVLAAYAAAHRAPADATADDSLAARAAALRLPVVSWAEHAIDIVAVASGLATLSSAFVKHALRWDAAAPTLAWARALIDLLDGWFERGVKKPVVKGNWLPLGANAHIWRGILAELTGLAALLVDVERADRRCRLRVPEPARQFDDMSE